MHVWRHWVSLLHTGFSLWRLCCGLGSGVVVAGLVTLLRVGPAVIRGGTMSLHWQVISWLCDHQGSLWMEIINATLGALSLGRKSGI